MGLVKKVVLADSVAPYANGVFTVADSGTTVAFADAWVGTTAYMMQLYFDFSGYSDMALGLARMFGIRLPLNFNSTYRTSSIIDSCNRWHMTLSRFLRDYIFVPLNRLGPRRRAVNLLLVMLVAGLWHGAAWTFVFWGGLLGIYLMVNYGWRHELVSAITELNGELPESAHLTLWDFGRMNDITTEPVPAGPDVQMRWWRDSHHFRPEVGDMILDRLLGYNPDQSGSPPAFGVILTTANIDEQNRRFAEDVARFRQLLPTWDVIGAGRQPAP